MGFGVSEEQQDIVDEFDSDGYNYSSVRNQFEELKKTFDTKIVNAIDQENLSVNESDKYSIEDLQVSFNIILDILDDISYLDVDTSLTLTGLILNIGYEIERIDHNKIDKLIFTIFTNLESFKNTLENYIEISKLKKYEEKAKIIIKNLNAQKKELEQSILQSKVLSDDLKNKKINEIFEDDSKRFKKIARIYEFLFYLVVLIAGLYFLGLTFYIVGFDAKYLSIGFPEKIHGNISAEFYIQKISFLVLSTTLAAFLLKRSFMNRRLADEAYRTAKELDALPRYMEGMPDEMKEKIRFDLAYKYFGNGIHHDSYTGGENLMHENIKANTEFVKVVKGVPNTTDESKADKDKNE